MIEDTEILTVGTYVHVDFVSESRTSFSGKRFTGNGVLDYVDDRYVMGRLVNNIPFMCGHDDVKPIQVSSCDKPFKLGDYVFLNDTHFTEMWVITNILPDQSIELKTSKYGYPVPTQCWGMYYGKASGLRHATADEKELKRRLDINTGI